MSENERLARIETKVDFLIDTINGDDGIHRRVKELESLKNRAWGFIIAMGATGAALGTSISKAIANIFH
jgi:hypothetical protein